MQTEKGETSGNEEAPQSNNNDNKSEHKFNKFEERDPSRGINSSTPLFPDEIYQLLPDLLKRSCACFPDRRERDLFLLSALTILSGCFYKVKGTYDQRTTHPPFYSFIVAPPASGKGAMTFAKQLGMKRHRNLMDQLIVKTAEGQTESNSNAGITQPLSNNIELPGNKKLFVPANSSAAAVIWQLSYSDGAGIICESEADTLSETLKQDWGNYSDMTRKAWEHESISYCRITIKKGMRKVETIEIPFPCIAILLTGTPAQLIALLKSSENGLFSRFGFYSFKAKPVWRDVSTKEKINLTDYFEKVSEEVNTICEFLDESPTEIKLTDEQWSEHNRLFDQRLKEISTFFNEDASSIVKRLGKIQYRICQVLTALRKFEKKSKEEKQFCEDSDFLITTEITEVLLKHSLLMFETLPKSTKSDLKPILRKFLDALPLNKEITRAQADAIGVPLGIEPRTVYDYLKALDVNYVENTRHGHFRRIA